MATLRLRSRGRCPSVYQLGSGPGTGSATTAQKRRGTKVTAAPSLFGALRPQGMEPRRPPTRAILGIVVRPSSPGWALVCLVLHGPDGAADQELGSYPADLAGRIADEQATSRDIPRLYPLFT